MGEMNNLKEKSIYFTIQIIIEKKLLNGVESP